MILASPPLDYGLNMSYFVVAHFHYTIFAGSAFGLFGGIYYWFPKVTGVMLRERLGQGPLRADGDRHEPHVLPDVRPRRRGHGPPHRPLPALERLAGAEQLETVGAFVIALVGARVHRQRRRLAAPTAGRPGDDPWQAHTLEWATSSPPPRHNFDALPPIRSYAPLLDLREASERAPARRGWRREARRDRVARVGAWLGVLTARAGCCSCTRRSRSARSSA